MTVPSPSTLELRTALQQSHSQLRETLDALPPGAADRGGWSPGQVLALVAFWDRYQSERLQRALTGESLPTELEDQAGGAEENDARAANERRGLAEPFEESTAARAALLAFVSALSEDQLHARYDEGSWPLSLVQLIHQVGIWHVRAHTAALPGGATYSGNPPDLDLDYFPGDADSAQ
jgi:hypothetical protein